MLQPNSISRFARSAAEPVSADETSFFRDRSQFHLLRDRILPALIENNQRSRTLRIWSAAACTGQEAYSVSMLLSDHFPHLDAWDVRIFGTDISRPWVQYARAARYRRREVNRGLPARMLLKYMTRDGEEWEVVPHVRDRCEFRQMNLCGPAPNLPQFDLVLLRNVLLYLSPEERSALFRTVYRHLQPNGFLLLDAGEQAEDSTRLFEPEAVGGCYFYRPAPGLPDA